MAAKLNAFKIKDWKQINNKSFCYEGEDRPAIRIGIGEMQQADDTKQFLVEPFYEDILPLIDDKSVTVHIDIYAEPMVVLEANGRLVIHNANVKLLKEETIEALKEDKIISINTQLKCLASLRKNIQAGEKLDASTKSLREMLSEGLPKKVSYDFIRLVLKEMYVSIPADDEIAGKLMFMSNEDLINLHAGIIDKKITDGTNINPLMKMLIDGYDFEEIEEAYKNEITRRFFEGSIR